MGLIQPLPYDPLDIIGDIHGEYDALLDLLNHLGYDNEGHHPDRRTVVFLGDYVDRGPNSPAVLALVQRWIEAGRAVGILGNHEINLLLSDAKEGAGWFFDSQYDADFTKFGPCQRLNCEERSRIAGFLSTLPIGLERNDLRIIHAVWNKDRINQIRQLEIGSVANEFDRWETLWKSQADSNIPPDGLKDEAYEPAFHLVHAEYEQRKQMGNPLKVLTSGEERIIDYPRTKPFYAGGKWRFVRRVPWWDEYSDDVPVVVGHYWRREMLDFDSAATDLNNTDLFNKIHPYSWHGLQGNVFCVDFSVGARWEERADGTRAAYRTRLAALRWPERTLTFDDGRVIQTEYFKKQAI